MPIYEYICQECGEKYEKLIRSSATPIKLSCPTCGSDRGKKALSLLGAVGGGSSVSSKQAATPSCGAVG
jgi:putative FmdB family regulatory protein